MFAKFEWNCVERLDTYLFARLFGARAADLLEMRLKRDVDLERGHAARDIKCDLAK